jgi:hypothetical protein
LSPEVAEKLPQSAEAMSPNARPGSDVASAPPSEDAGEAHGEARPTPTPSPEPLPIPTVASMSPVGPAVVRGKPARWKLHHNAHFGFALKYPAELFTSETGEHDINDRLLVSRDGRSLLRIYSGPNSARTPISKYRTSLLRGRYAGAVLDYAPQRDSWFVLSGTLGQEMFYERVTFSCDGRSIHGWLLIYPLSERWLYDPIVEDIHRSYRYGDLPSRRCAEAKSQTRVRKARAEAGAIEDVTLF